MYDQLERLQLLKFKLTLLNNIRKNDTVITFSTRFQELTIQL